MKVNYPQGSFQALIALAVFWIEDRVSQRASAKHEWQNIAGGLGTLWAPRIFLTHFQLQCLQKLFLAIHFIFHLIFHTGENINRHWNTVSFLFTINNKLLIYLHTKIFIWRMSFKTQFKIQYFCHVMDLKCFKQILPPFPPPPPPPPTECTEWGDFGGHWRVNGTGLMQLTNWYLMCIICLI